MGFGVNIRCGDISSYFSKPMGIENKWGRTAVQAARIFAAVCGVGLVIEGGCLLALLKNRIHQVKFNSLKKSAPPNEYGVTESQVKRLKNGSIILVGNDAYILSNKIEGTGVRTFPEMKVLLDKTSLRIRKGDTSTNFTLRLVHSFKPKYEGPVSYEDL